MALTQEQQRFLDRIGNAASADMARSGVLASLTTAQAILESGWGKSELALKANALFGIKAGAGWKGRVYTVRTKECYDGKNYATITAIFRAYKAWESAITDHSAFLTGSQRYAAVIGERDYIKACYAIAAAGYATAPDYAERLIRMIEQYDLTKYDAAGGAEKGTVMVSKAKRVFIGIGHGGADPGAVANGLRESDVNLVAGLELQRILDYHGVETAISRTRDENDPLAEEIKEAIAFRPDLAVECHANAGGGDGFEVFYQTNALMGQSLALAKAIEAEVMRIGQNSRGCKTRKNTDGFDYFGWLRQNPFPAVLCEAFFLDSAARAIGDTVAEQQRIGLAYAKGVLKILGIPFKGSPPQKPVVAPAKPTAPPAKPTPTTAPPSSAAMKPYTVKITSLPVNIRNGPGITRAKVGQITELGAYTIVEEKAGPGAVMWGRLKSGAGWISLDYTQRIGG